MISLLLSLAALVPSFVLEPVAETGPEPVSERVETELAALQSMSSDDRQRAQRWLTANLEVTHFPFVVEAADAGGEELHARLIDVLADDDRHFELAALLASERAGDARAVGRGALGELCLRWTPAADRAPARHAAVEARLGERAVGRFSMAFESRSLLESVELLAMIGDSNVALVLDPDLLRSPNVPKLADDAVGTHVGNQGELLERLRDGFSLGLDGFAFDSEKNLAWMRICKRVREGRKPARELLVDWCVRVVKRRSQRDARACARALADSTWPAALRWMSRRYRERGDDACLEGLIAAAAKGRVVPAFSSKLGQDVLITRAQAALAADDMVSFSRIARALASIGSVSPLGVDLSAELIAGKGRALSWLSLVAIEGRGGGDEAAREFVSAAVGASTRGTRDPGTRDPGTRDPWTRDLGRSDPIVALQALRAARRIALRVDGALDFEHCERLFEYAIDLDGGRELVRLLIACGIDPPERAALRADRGWESRARLALAEWMFFRAEQEGTAQLLISVSSAGQLARSMDDDPASNALVRRLRDWTRAVGEKRVQQLLEVVFAGLEDAGAKRRVTRAALHAGCLERDLEVELSARLFLAAERGDLEQADLLALGALAASPRGADARRILIEISLGRNRQKRQLATRPALEEALRVLRRTREDQEVEAFVLAVNKVVLHSRNLADGPWPPPHRPDAVPARILERSFEP